MRLVYYTYWLHCNQTERRYRVNIEPLLAAFCRYSDIGYKSQFRCDEERLFLKPNVSPSFIFFITRDTDIIRRLNTRDYSDDDLRDALNEDESIVFASYAFVDESLLAFCTTRMAAPIGVFIEFCNKILQSLGINQYEMKASPLIAQTTIDEAVSLPFIGRTRLSVSAENPLGQHVLGLFGGDVDEQELLDLDGIEIILKPRIRRNIRGIASRAMNLAHGVGVRKIELKGMSTEEYTRQVEMFINSQGAFAETIANTDRRTLHDRIAEKVEDNPHLSQLLESFHEQAQLEEMDGGPIGTYSDVSAWARSARILQTDSD